MQRQLEEDLRDTQQANTLIQADIDERLDKIATLETQVSCLKKEIVSTSQRHYKYLQELQELMIDLDHPVTALRCDVKETKQRRHTLESERDKVFKKMIDLQVERRVILSKVNIQDKSLRLMQQSDLQACR